jgi:N-acetylmuramoyl-L-alanine amidase
VCDHVGLRTSTPAAVTVFIVALGLWAGAQAPIPAPAPAVPGNEAPRPSPPVQSSTPEAPQPGRILPAVIIDPGHGGDDLGVHASAGLDEKQLTLDIARRLRTLLEANGSVRALLTRDTDAPVTLDARAAFANANAGMLFVSLHGNAGPASTVEGAEVYYHLPAKSDVLRPGRTTVPANVPGLAGGTRTLELVPWDRLQLPHLDASAAFADLLAMKMGGRMPVGVSPVRRAPMRVLQSVNMPAVLVELAFLTNPAQEKLVATSEFKNQAALILSEAILQFQRPPDPRVK